MIINYIDKIKANIELYAHKKTSNILDGSYKSIYKGRSMNFEDLREYVIGDNIKDIDWKASARSNTILIRQYIAEKKHNIMLVLDSDKKMLADTKQGDSKKDVSIITAGTLAYLANKNGDYVGSIYESNNKISLNPLKYGLNNIEKILFNYEKDVKQNQKSDLQKSLEYITKYIKKRMIIFVITDLDGMELVKENTLKMLSMQHDVMFINISDADIYGNNTYDIENDTYIPNIILKNTKLHKLEQEKKKEIYDNCEKKLKKHAISTVTIDHSKDVVIKIIDLLERHKYASIR